MAITKRLGKRRISWVVDYRDASGKRRYVTCRTKAEADRVQLKKLREKGGNPHATFGEVAAKWLELAKGRVRDHTYRLYERNLRLHALPAFGKARLSKLVPSDVELLLSQKLKVMKPQSVATIQSTIYGVFKLAVRDGVVASNVAEGLGVEVGLKRRAPVEETVKAFTPHELERFLTTSRGLYPDLFPLFLTMARTGVRIGEAIALQWADVELEGRLHAGRRIYQIHVQRSMQEDGTLVRPKNNRTRFVDMSAGLRAELGRLLVARKEEALRCGRKVEDWVFVRPSGGYLRRGAIRHPFRRALEASGLPAHFHPHSLRHTFASIHIQLGSPITYIKEQLGHSSIQVTVDIYGHWLSKTNPEAADRLDTIGMGP